MRKLIIALMLAAGIYGCASTSVPKDAASFSTANYQQFVVNSMDYMDNFAEFNDKDFPQANLDSQDFSAMLQADVAFNQGAYDTAAKAYYDLAVKYKDPRMIYKGIVCYQHISTAAQDFAKLNQLIVLLSQVAPKSDIAELYAIQSNLDAANLQGATDNLNTLVQKYPDRARDILLFVSTLLSSRNYPLKEITITKFGDYVLDKYSKYPEAYLVASVAYSDSDSEDKLLSVLNQIQHKYPTWEFPVFWNAGVLASDANIKLLNAMIDQEMAIRKNPTPNMENLIVSVLVKLDRINDAEKYVDNSADYKAKSGNMLVNKAVINYRLGKSSDSLVELQAAQQAKYNLDGAVDFVLGGLYSVNNQKSEAIQYFKSAATTNPNLAPLAGVGVIRAYIAESNFAASDQYIESMANINKGKMGQKEVVYAKLSIYSQLQQYDYAYKIAQKYNSQYGKDKPYAYLLASLSGLSGHTKEAIGLYKSYIKLNPKDPSGYNDLGYILADKTTNYKEALTYAKKAYAMNPKDPAILDTLGWANYKLKNYADAEQYILQSYKLSPDAETGNHLKQIYLAENKTSEANSLVIPDNATQQQQIDKQILDQGMLVLMYYQFGSDFGK